jgi:hypothetical protein
MDFAIKSNGMGRQLIMPTHLGLAVGVPVSQLKLDLRCGAYRGIEMGRG